MSAVPHIYRDGDRYPIRDYVKKNMALYFVSLITFMVVYFALICCESVRRTHPTNLICTGILTLSIGFVVFLTVLVGYPYVLFEDNILRTNLYIKFVNSFSRIILLVFNFLFLYIFLDYLTKIWDLPTNEKNALVFLQERGLLHKTRLCRNGHEMKICYNVRPIWQCYPCR